MNVLTGEDGRLRAIWRCVLSFTFAFFIANNLAGGLALHVGWLGSLGFELVYRPIWLGLLLAGFSLFVILLDRRPTPLRVMGLGRPWWLDTAKGMAIGAGMVTVGVAFIAVMGTVTLTTGHYRQAAARLAAVVFVLIAAAMAEELTFRGYPFQRLLDAFGPAAAVVIMSVQFGAVHLGNPGATVIGFLNTALIGGVLCLAYLRTWRLWLPFGIHFGWNFMLGMVLGLPVSGLNEFAVFVAGRARGPIWLTGGRYGMEASLTGTGVILLGFLALVAFVPVTKRPEDVEEPPMALGLESPPVPQPVPPDAGMPSETKTDAPPPESHPTE